MFVLRSVDVCGGANFLDRWQRSDETIEQHDADKHETTVKRQARRKRVPAGENPVDGQQSSIETDINHQAKKRI